MRFCSAATKTKVSVLWCWRKWWSLAESWEQVLCRECWSIQDLQQDCQLGLHLSKEKSTFLACFTKRVTKSIALVLPWAHCFSSQALCGCSVTDVMRVVFWGAGSSSFLPYEASWYDSVLLFLHPQYSSVGIFVWKAPRNYYNFTSGATFEFYTGQNGIWNPVCKRNWIDKLQKHKT